MNRSVLLLLTGLVCNEEVLASRLYDPFEGGKIICHREDLQSRQSKEYYFRSNFSVPTTDKQTRFKPAQIQLMTAQFQKEGLFFKTRKLTTSEDLNLYLSLDDKVVLCGESLSKSDLTDCSYHGGDDSTQSPEMVYTINCKKWRLHMEIFQNKELQVECTNSDGKVMFKQNFFSCIRS